MTITEALLSAKSKLSQTAIGTPAIANLSSSKLQICWAGTDPVRSLNIMSSTDGRHFSGKVTLDERSIGAPGLGFVNGHVYLAWAGPTAATA